MIIWVSHKNDALKYEVPFTVEEIPFGDHCDFQQKERFYIDLCRPPELEEDGSNKEEVDSWELPVEDAIKALVETVNQIVKGDLTILPFNLDNEDVGKLIDSGYRILINDDLSIIRLYAHLLTVIREYKPDRIPTVFKAKHKGDTFLLSKRYASDMLLGRTGAKLSTGEALEILEYQRRFAKAVKAKPLEVGNLDFTLGLTEVSILLRKEGERLPWSRTHLDDFIDERRRLFKDLPLSDVLSLRFFLLDSLLVSRKREITRYSGRGVRRRQRRNARKESRSNG